MDTVMGTVTDMAMADTGNTENMVNTVIIIHIATEKNLKRNNKRVME